MKRHRLHRTQRVERSIEEVFAFFAEPRNLERLTPPALRFEILGCSTPECQLGSLIDYRLRLHGIPFHWRTVISRWEPGRLFVDEALVSPYRLWEHTHRFRAEGPETTVIEDVVDYALPFGFLGELFHFWVRRELEGIFDFRAEVVRAIFPTGSLGLAEPEPGGQTEEQRQ